MVNKSEVEDARHCFETVKLVLNSIQKPGLCNCREKKGIQEGQQGTLEKDAE